MRVVGYSSNALGVILKYLGFLSGALCTRPVSDVQLVKQTEMVKSAIEEAERQTRKVFITTRFL